MNEGYFLIDLGNILYTHFTKNLINSIKEYDSRPIAVLSNKENINYGHGVDVIYYNKENFSEKYNVKEAFEILGCVPKLEIPNLTPFEKTIFLDSDCFLLKSTDFLWDVFLKYDFPIGVNGISDENNSGPSSWHWGNLREIESKCGFFIPRTDTVILYFNKSKLKDYDQIVVNYILNWEKYGIKRQFRWDSLVDEIIFAIYMGYKKIRPYDSNLFKLFKHSSEFDTFKDTNEYVVYHDFVLKTYLLYKKETKFEKFQLEKFKNGGDSYSEEYQDFLKVLPNKTNFSSKDFL